MSKNAPKILIVDDNQDILLTARVLLSKNGYEPSLVSNPDNIIPMLKGTEFDLVLLDMNYKSGATSGEEGIFWLKEIMKLDLPTSVVMITAYGEIDLAVEAMKQGAIDFIVKPWENKKFLATVQSAVRLSSSKREINSLKSKQNALIKEIGAHQQNMIIGESEAMLEVFNTIEKVSKTDANILILGENGTGKELVANAIHEHSDRSKKAFISVDLGSIPESLFESELFGHKKGAFTDAKEDRAGRFEIASGGTLFLDEIGNLPLAMQAKLLTAIQKKEITIVGTNTAINVDIRLVSATNMHLTEMVNDGTFRQDLLYRLNTIELKLPALRDREDDIELLANHFLQIYAKKYKDREMKIGQDAIKKLKKYSWPGNVRELQHMIERTVIMNDNSKLSADDFLINTPTGKRVNSKLNLEDIEKQTIHDALKKHQFNVTAAAKELGLGRTTMYRKMSKYGF